MRLLRFTRNDREGVIARRPVKADEAISVPNTEKDLDYFVPRKIMFKMSSVLLFCAPGNIPIHNLIGDNGL